MDVVKLLQLKPISLRTAPLVADENIKIVTEMKVEYHMSIRMYDFFLFDIERCDVGASLNKPWEDIHPCILIFILNT